MGEATRRALEDQSRHRVGDQIEVPLVVPRIRVGCVDVSSVALHRRWELLI